ncbi:TPA: glutathione binding-like protein [Escherichia coli]
MKLFYKPGACSLASHITLRESGKDFTLVSVDLMKKRLENGDDYFAVNPKGQVPALLLDDGTLLTEGVAIMQYLADSVPDRQLLAPVEYKPTVRAQLEKKLQYVNEALKDEHWICGQRFTIADAYLFTVLRWAYAVKLNLEGLEHIAAFMQRMAERPEVQDALSAEGLK